MNRYILPLIFISTSSYSAKFPASYVCDNGDNVHIMMTDFEQRLIYSSSKYGKLNGYLDVFLGEKEYKNEAIADIHGLVKINDNPFSYTLQVQTDNGVVKNGGVTYNYIFGPKSMNESGNCIPVKDGVTIEGDKRY